MLSRQYDVVFFGATGSTGTVAARYFAGMKDRPKFAIAGRNEAKLNALKETLSNNEDIGVIVANVKDVDSLREMCKLTRLLVTYMGPYEKCGGEKVIVSCIEEKTHYSDITGETVWVTKMRNKYESDAKAAGVSIISFCAYDSIPAELSAWVAIRGLQKLGGGGDESTGVKERNVEYVTVFPKRGGIPRGSLLTMCDIAESRFKSEQYFAFCENKSASQAALSSVKGHWCPSYVRFIESYTMPHFMAMVNIPVASRTINAMTSFKQTKIVDRIKAVNIVMLFLSCILQFWFIVALVLRPTRALLRYVATNHYKYEGHPDAKIELYTKITEEYTSDKAANEIVVHFSFKGDAGIFGTAFLSCNTARAILDGRDTLPSGFTTPVLACGPHLEKRLLENGAELSISSVKGAIDLQGVQSKIADGSNRSLGA